jgi:predicted flavoprotein YhiN
VFYKVSNFSSKQKKKIQNKINKKIQEKAVLNLIAELAIHNKTFDNYSDEELEILLSREKQKIIDNLKDKSIIAVLSILGLNIFL